MTKKYTLTMDAEQARVMVLALDLYSRIGIGQFENVLEVYDRPMSLSYTERERVRFGLNIAKEAAGHPVNGSYGIHNPEVRDEFRVVWDLQQVVRHRLAHDARPEGNPMHVHFDTPHQCSQEPLATIVSEDVGEPAPVPT